ncbi:MAG TPA: hypothetical protein PLR16_07190 [Bacilli bacterium]|mgnify:FL=1|nr:hypothetical protein [Bacilli bacterium]
MTTSKLLDNLYKNLSWLIVLMSIIGYLAYRTFQMEGDIQSVANDPNTWLNIAFVIWLNLNVQSGAINSGITAGVDSEEFKAADEINNKIIKSVNNEMVEFRKYVKTLNYNEMIRVQENFLYKYGVDDVSELNKKQLRKFKRLKPIRHDISGFNLPLYYELTKNGEIKYESSFNKNKGMLRKRAGKVLTGILFGALSVNIAFNIDGLGEAMMSVIVISTNLIITYLLSFMPPMFRLKFVIPKGVILKHTLYSGYIEYKKGTHILKEIPMKKEVLEVVEQEKTQEE